MKKVFIILIFSVFIFFSCSKTHEYNAEINNNTNYKIDTLMIDCAIRKTKITINKKSKKKTLLLYKKSSAGLFSEPLLCITILRYTDNNRSYNNTIGSTFSISNLDENKTNNIKIELNTNPTDSNNIFKISLNK